MTNFPRLPRRIQLRSNEINIMRGINLSSNFSDGDLADCQNLSVRRFPFFTTRRAREKLKDYAKATALTAWEKLVVVQNDGDDETPDYQLYYDGTARGSVEGGEKQFAVVNSKLVIWPDKKYLDMNTMIIKDLGASISGDGAIFITDKITVAWTDVDLTKLFAAGDCITVSGCTVEPDNNKDIVIKEVGMTFLVFEDNSFTAATETDKITFERKIPDMDFIFENDNRLWGCSNTTKTIYASALGDPTNFFTYEGLSTDSYALTVGSEGDFTGCCKLSASVLFWKDHTLHKILGDYPAEYTLYTYSLEGVLAGCNKSLQVVNETLYYMSAHGIYSYSGGTTAPVSMAFGERRFTNAVGGTDGENYYLSVKEGDKHHLLVLNSLYGIWVREDDTEVVDFARIGKDIYLLNKEGDVYLCDSGEESDDIEWYALFVPFYGTYKQSNKSNTPLERKGFSKLLMRVELPASSWMRIETKCDGGRWRRAGEIKGGTTDVQAFHIAIERCDKFELRLSGKGQCTVLSVMRQFVVGSER